MIKTIRVFGFHASPISKSLTSQCTSNNGGVLSVAPTTFYAQLSNFQPANSIRNTYNHPDLSIFKFLFGNKTEQEKIHPHRAHREILGGLQIASGQLFGYLTGSSIPCTFIGGQL